MAISPASTLETAVTTANRVIDSASAALRTLSLDIHSHPELNFEEHHAHDALTGYLETQGFSVERGAFELATAFQAVAGSGSPTIAVFSEFDALPGIGHACGHNLIAISGVATALALKAALGEGNGTVVLLGSPAEEGGGGKALMIERGALEGIDAALMLHPAPIGNALPHMIAAEHLEVRFHGKGTHAGASPWMGINALDAIVLAYTNISALRQQLHATDRVHGVITNGGEKANIIPHFTSSQWIIRAHAAAELTDLKRRVTACFEAAATATGCTLEIEVMGPAYDDLRQNEVMGRSYLAAIEGLGAQHVSHELRIDSGAVTDMGNVSYVVPSIHPVFGIPATDGNHTPGFTAAAATEEAHAATLMASKALAATALELFLEPEVLSAAKAEFAATVRA
ncbi:MAG: M20 family metallopeptidase [Tepidiformaceae bacterium]